MAATVGMPRADAAVMVAPVARAVTPPCKPLANLPSWQRRGRCLRCSCPPVSTVVRRVSFSSD
jgi:hypothetical protein